MDADLLKDLIVNAAMMSVLSALLTFGYNRIHKGRKLTLVVLGLSIGAAGYLIMLQGASFDSLHILDANLVLIGAAGMFYGALPTLIGLGCLILLRVLYGGAGLLAGVAGLIFSAGLGLAWNRWKIRRDLEKQRQRYIFYYVFGLCSVGLALASFFLLPGSLDSDTLRRAALPVSIVYPAAYLIVCSMGFLAGKITYYEVEIKQSERRFQTFFQNAPIGVAIVRGMAEFLFINAMFARILGRSKEELDQSTWQSAVHPDDLLKMAEGMRAFFASEIDEYRDTFRTMRPDGSFIWVYMVVTVIDHDLPRDQAQYYLLTQEITELYESQRALEESARQTKALSERYEEQFYFLRSLLDSMEDWIFSKDVNGVYRSCNKAFARSVGLPEEEIIGRTTEEIVRRLPSGALDHTTLPNVLETDRLLIETGMPQHYEETFGDQSVMEIIKTPYYDHEGKLLGISCIGRNITERKRREAEILYIGEHDVMTGLYNRAYFERYIREMDTRESLPITVVMCDLNALNLVNDSFGHDKGDDLIRGAAHILGACSRDKDVVARIGGDEFFVVMPNTTEEEAKQVLECVESTYASASQQPDSILRYSSLAMGTATKRDAEEPLSETIKIAEEYMYRRKLITQKGVHGAILNSIRSTLFEKSFETQEHADRIAYLARRVGELLNLSADDLDLLQLAAGLHDIGKISIDQAILTKPAPLTDDEWKRLQQHPEIGYRITQAIPELSQISEIVLTHHERWDGSGYPQGLKGEQIPLMARIVAVADAFDAMTEGRHYKEAVSKQEAVEELIRQSGKQFDPVIVKLFTEQVFPFLNGKDT
ncbi:hypothetical protein SDC9_50801 [bioreactor metagenome]|uniref:Uncharacterized protein n=1 Tax=bioreactor metagenome TaxID=1076179 RepID=A0A644WQF0_9ZZZZ